MVRKGGMARTCQNCGASADVDDQFCSGCGAILPPALEATPPFEVLEAAAADPVVAPSVNELAVAFEPTTQAANALAPSSPVWNNLIALAAAFAAGGVISGLLVTFAVSFHEGEVSDLLNASPIVLITLVSLGIAALAAALAVLLVRFPSAFYIGVAVITVLLLGWYSVAKMALIAASVLAKLL